MTVTSRLATREARRIQSGWAVAAGGLLLLFVAGMGQAFAIARTLQPETLQMLAARGLPADAPAAFLLAIDTLALLTFAVVATLLMIRRPGERMAQIAAVMLLLTGLLYTAPAYEAPAPLWLKSLLSSAAEVSQVAFLFAFPSGRFVPRWMPLALIPIFVWRFAMWHWVYLPNLFAMQRPGERYPFLPQDPRDIGLFFLLLVAGVVLQVYRYRRLSSATERQQVKWLLGGTAAAIGAVGVYVIGSNLVSPLLPPHSELFVRLGGRTVRHAALALVPISLVYSILRHRLWDIDRLLSLTVTYSAITGTLAAIFAALVVSLQVLFAPRTEVGATAIVAASTLATVALARPLYRRVQRAIDRRFYRPAFEAQQAVADLRARLRDPVAMEALAAHVLTVAQQAWQPHEVGLWVPAPPPGGDETAAEGSNGMLPVVRYRLER
jgi:uncharacterized membrane protein YidH (DUF202 family)